MRWDRCFCTNSAAVSGSGSRFVCALVTDTPLIVPGNRLGARRIDPLPIMKQHEEVQATLGVGYISIGKDLDLEGYQPPHRGHVSGPGRRNRRRSNYANGCYLYTGVVHGGAARASRREALEAHDCR